MIIKKGGINVQEYKRITINRILLRFTSILLLLVVISLYITTGSLAKYKSENSLNDSARVGKFGELNFYEYKSDGTTLVSGDEAQIENIVVIAGNNIDKNLHISYSGNEIAVYIFFVVDSDGWKIINNENTNELLITNNNNEKMVSWTINNNWHYLEESSNTKHIFYHLVEANTNFDDAVMPKLEVNALSLDDVELLKNPSYSLKFKALAVSALGKTPAEAWNYISNNWGEVWKRKKYG